MPTYQFRCESCGDFTQWRSIHDEALSVHDCGLPCVMILPVPQISVDATPNKGHRVREIVATERNWHRDMGAYKRLRMNGLQPKSIDGCGDLETRAQTKTEVERGRVSALNRILDREGLGT